MTLRFRLAFCLAVTAVLLPTRDAKAREAMIAGDEPSVRSDPQLVGTVSGTVKDSLGSPIADATVSVDGIRRDAMSGADGRYTIAGVPAGPQTISARRIGYRQASQKVIVRDGATTTVNFALTVAATSLEAIVVTGTTGSVERITQAAVVTSVDAASVQAVQAPQTMQQMLNGNVAGASVEGTGPQAGAATHIIIRGPSSAFLNNEPLVFIDGVQVQATPRSLLSLGGQQADPLESLNPEDIASVEIVKGPAAATLYGANASAGVINILTKRGGAGAMTQTLTVDVAQNDVGYTPYTNYGKCSAGQVLSSSPAVLCHGLAAGSVVSDSPLLRTGTFRVGRGGKIDYSLRGGGSDYGYFASAAVSNEQGVMVPDGLHEITSHGNFFWTAKPILTFNIGMNLGESDNFLSQADQGNALTRGGFGGSPLTVFVNSQGQLDGGWRQSPGLEKDYFDGLRNEYRTLRSTPTLEVNLKPVSWFNNRLRLGADISQVYANSYIPIDPALSGSAAVGTSNDIHQALNVYTLDYAGTIHVDVGRGGSIGSDLTFGAQYIEQDNNQLNALGQAFISNGASIAGLGASTAVQSELITAQKSFGVLAQEDLAFGKKFYAQLGVRVDQNSSFGSAAPAFVLPKVGVSYVISQESFWSRFAKLVPTLRLRAAYGTTGRAPPPGASLATYSAAAFVVGGTAVPGVVLNNPGNPHLKAEVGTEFETGVDASSANDRVNLEVTYFSKTSRNLLIQDPEPPSAGYLTNPYVNVGAVNNQGFEVTLRATPVDRRRDVRWDVTLSGSTLKNRVLSIGNIAPFTNQTTVEPGYPLGSWFANQFVSTNVATNTNIVTDTTVYLGNTNPSLTANLTNTVTLFGRLTLSGLLVTKRGFTVYNFSEYYRDLVLGDGGGPLLPYGKGGYSPTEMTQIFGKSYGEKSGLLIQNPSYNPNWFQSGDFVRLQQLSASLELPSFLVRQIGGTRPSITVGASNLRTWTSYKGLDPDATSFTPSASGPTSLSLVDVWAAPPPRRFFTRFSVQF